MNLSTAYQKAFTEGQRDAVILQFPIKTGGNTESFFLTSKHRYDHALQCVFSAELTGAGNFGGETGYADGMDSACLEIWKLLGIHEEYW